jgi:4,5-DOPA dioxygenase extradiol
MTKMPVLFIGHGSPMNAIEENRFVEGWRQMTASLPQPKAILALSAHWYTRGTLINNQLQPKQIYDMYGFPPELYQLKYPAPGSPKLADQVARLLPGKTRVDNSWGLDHGSWSILSKIFPAANIPVVSVSLNGELTPQEQLTIGSQLSSLRDEGILIFASGNVVHNLGRLNWDMPGGYAWADHFDHYIRDRILAGDFNAVLDFASQGQEAQLACPTPEHFLPLLYALGAAGPKSQVQVFNDARTMGSLSMTSYLFQ